MSNGVTLDEVEKLATRLPPPERLKLVAHVCEQLAGTVPREAVVESTDPEHLRRVDAWLAECDAIAEGIEGQP